VQRTFETTSLTIKGILRAVIGQFSTQSGALHLASFSNAIALATNFWTGRLKLYKSLPLTL
jgi:hypothetical protein